MERDVGGDGLWPEGASVFLFIDQFDLAHPESIVVEVEILGVVDGVTNLDALTDIGGGDLVDGALEADGGVIIDDAFMADEKDLIEFSAGKSADGDS